MKQEENEQDVGNCEQSLPLYIPVAVLTRIINMGSAADNNQTDQDKKSGHSDYCKV